MLKETETEETIVFVCDVFIIGSIPIWEGPGPLPPPPLATPMRTLTLNRRKNQPTIVSRAAVLHKLSKTM